MDLYAPIAPRILILESDGRTRATLRRLAVKGWRGASVHAAAKTLEEALEEPDKLRSFDVLLVGCDFYKNGTAENPMLRALRGLSSDPANPAVVVLADHGSEYTAVQAIKAGAFDYIPKSLLGREQLRSAVQRALLQRRESVELDPQIAAETLSVFGYDIRRRLARHDRVSLHVAYSAEWCKEVVLKVLHRHRGSLARDMQFHGLFEEFKLLCDIHDPAVAEIYDFRVSANHCCIAMEYFPLGHLGSKLQDPLAPSEALGLAEEIAHALSIVHAAGVVHRDLKPGNVMLRADGTVALIDFGISRTINDTGAFPAEQDARISGTPYYMSPEQARGEPTDERTDLYALGIIVFQMLTGEKPYVGDSAQIILDQHCNAPLPRLPEHLSRCQGLLDRLLAKNPEQRVSSAREIAEAFQQAQRAEADQAPLLCYPASA